MLCRRLTDSKIIVTGAASGIGRAVVLRLVSEGATVLGVDLNEAGLQETVTLATQSSMGGGTARSAVADVSEEGDAKAIVASFVTEEGQLDALVNMAGVLRSVHTTDESVDEFMRMVRVNLLGTFVWCREALPHLEMASGCIVNAASTSAFFGHPYMTAYSATKGGIAAMTHALAWEYLKRGVRVNAVAPGGIATPMVEAQQHAFPAAADLTLFGHLARPDLTFGDPADVAAVVAMLVSKDGRFLTGEVIRIDGGVHS